MEKHYKRTSGGLYQSVLADIPCNTKLKQKGVLLAKFQKIKNDKRKKEANYQRYHSNI
jgi:hypothetical protein